MSVEIFIPEEQRVSAVLCVLQLDLFDKEYHWLSGRTTIQDYDIAILLLNPPRKSITYLSSEGILYRQLPLSVSLESYCEQADLARTKALLYNY